MVVTAVQALDAAVGRLADAARALAAGPPGDERWRERIRPPLMALHDAAMRVTVDDPDRGAASLASAAAVVREIAEGMEGGTGVRQRIFVRLLRAGALEPAWMLAGDNASGVVTPARAVVMWAGGSQLRNALPLPTLAEGPRIYAWLPGFRDPRWHVPDGVYDITDELSLCVELHHLSLTRGRLFLAGTGFLTDIAARPDDGVAVVLAGPGGQECVTPAVRARTPEFVEPQGPELTRLAWAGWHAEIDLTTRLAGAPGRWSCRLRIAQGGVHRAAPLGVRRGPFAELVRASGPQEAAGWVYRLGGAADRQVTVAVTRLGPSARLLPRPARRALRRLFPRR